MFDFHFRVVAEQQELMVVVPKGLHGGCFLDVRVAAPPPPQVPAKGKGKGKTANDGRYYEGVVKKLGGKYGFIDCPGAQGSFGNSDVFLIPTSGETPDIFENLEVGTPVRFQIGVQVGKDGKTQPRAENLVVNLAVNNGKSQYSEHLKTNPNMKLGDWICPTCGHLNFARRTECGQKEFGMCYPGASSGAPPGGKGAWGEAYGGAGYGGKGQTQAWV